MTAPWATHNWNFRGSQNAQELGEDGRTIAATRGKVLGGSSAVNGAVWNRGLKVDFEYWAKDLGCKGWEWENCLPFFNKVETDQDFGEDRRNHGRKGLIRAGRRDTGVGDPTAWRVSDKAYRAACLAAGWREIRDMNAEDDVDGFAPTCLNVVDRERWSSAFGYMDAATRARPNLTIRPDAEVVKVLFAPAGSSPPRACGVQLADGTAFECREEVILCASAVNSPRTLMLSGIGPADELTRHGITPVKVLEGVGRNVRDHPNVTLMVPLRDGVPADDTDGDKFPGAWHLRYTAPAAGAHKEVLPSDMMVFAGPLQGRSRNGTRAFIMTVVLNLARSQGRLTLASADPKDRPVLDYAYFSDPTDVPRLRDGVRKALRVLYSPEMKAVLEGQERRGLTEASSDDEIDAFIKGAVSTSFHICGTCKMGGASDPLAVCDEQARVYGVDRLRVVDCSLKPDAVRANLQFTVYMMAERISAQIRHGGDLEAALQEARALAAAA